MAVAIAGIIGSAVAFVAVQKAVDTIWPSDAASREERRKYEKAQQEYQAQRDEYNKNLQERKDERNDFIRENKEKQIQAGLLYNEATESLEYYYNVTQSKSDIDLTEEPRLNYTPSNNYETYILIGGLTLSSIVLYKVFI